IVIDGQGTAGQSDGAREAGLEVDRAAGRRDGDRIPERAGTVIVQVRYRAWKPTRLQPFEPWPMPSDPLRCFSVWGRRRNVPKKRPIHGRALLGSGRSNPLMGKPGGSIPDFVVPGQ